MADRVFRSEWLFLFPAAYFAHLADERYFWIGTADFVTRYLGIYFTNSAWWAVNVPSFVVLLLVSTFVARGSWPEWIAIAVAVHLALHGLARIPASIWTASIAPGLVTGILVCCPLAAMTLWRAARMFPRRELTRGIIVGIVSFQPLWHLVLLPVLPSRTVA